MKKHLFLRCHGSKALVFGSQLKRAMLPFQHLPQLQLILNLTKMLPKTLNPNEDLMLKNHRDERQQPSPFLSLARAGTKSKQLRHSFLFTQLLRRHRDSLKPTAIAASGFVVAIGLLVPAARANTSPTFPTFSAQVETTEFEALPHEDRDFPPASESFSDPELGTLRLEELNIVPASIEKPPVVYFIGQVGYLKSDNILLSARDPINDGLFRAGASLLAVPEISDRTALFASVGANLARYDELTSFDYNQFSANAGIRQRFFAETYGILGWSHQQLFTKRGGNRFLDEHSLYAEINRRDLLAPQIVFDTFYQTRMSFADPDERSQFLNTAGVSLGYVPSSQFQAFLDYQFLYASFTQQDRNDRYHQLTGRLVYRPSDNTRLELFGGRSFGNSSNESIDFNGFVFGASFGFNVPLF
jgi:hypothetical protein